MAFPPPVVKLTEPTDFDILEALDRYGRNVAANIAIRIDRDRAYINTRMPLLDDYGLVESIGPAPNAGLYQLTDHGQAVLDNREQYNDLDTDQFESLISD